MEFLWIWLYALMTIAFRRLDSGGLSPVPLEPWAMLCYSIALLVWLGTGRRRKVVGLNPIRFPKGWGRALWTLLLIPGCNLLFGTELSVSASVFAAALASAVAEEVFFRGFLLRWMEKNWKKAGFIGAAAVFALFHLGNIPSGGLPGTVLQVLCAFGAGLCYSGAAVYCGSLWIAIGAHFLVNLTGWGNPVGEITSLSGAALLFCAAAAGVSGVWMYQKYTGTKEKKGEQGNGILY